ncbi:MAG TPA: argininosuccinate lyase, partial [Verrucomicrobiae bacterium]|nr:argininosuccinate lyase [Verrucomicrobiae bacterium]
NKDMQEDKEALFDAIDTVQKCLLLTTPMLKTMEVNKDAMAKGAKGGFTNATDVADYLAKKGVPFREAHEIVGKLVLNCSQKKIPLEDMTLAEFQAVSPAFEGDLYEFITVEHCAKARKVPGGPAPEMVAEAINLGKLALAAYK